MNKFSDEDIENTLSILEKQRDRLKVMNACLICAIFCLMICLFVLH